MLFTWTSFLVVCNVFFGVTLLLRRRRRPGEPPLRTNAIPFIGEALTFGANPYKFLKDAQQQLGDVFTMKMAGWDYHFFMNPFDVVSMEKCPDIDQSVVLGDFVTRMVGSQHSIHNYEVPSFLDQIVNKVIGKRNYEPIPEKKLHLQPGHENQRSKQDDVSHAIVRNLRGTTQLQELCKSCVVNNVKCMTEKFYEVIENGKDMKVGLHELCKEIIFDFTFNNLMGSLPTEKERLAETKAFYKQFSKFYKNSALLVDRVPIHLMPETKKAREDLLKMISKLDFAKRINTAQMITDVIKANPVQEIRDRHLLILMWSSQANTIPALFWFLFYVLKEPLVQEKILNEYNELLDTKNKQQAAKKIHQSNSIFSEFLQLEKADLDKLIVLDSVLKEVMRITGTNLNLRRAIRDTTIRSHDGNKYKIRKGDYTAFYAPFVHFDEDIYSEPEKFIYDRFLEHEEVEDKSANDGISHHSSVKPRSKFLKKDKRINPARAVMTFGFGATRCPGRHLALMEVKVIAMTLIKYFSIDMKSQEVPEYDLRHIGFGVMPPVQDVNVSITRKV